MAPPGNGIFVVRGEMSTLMTAMKRGYRRNSNVFQDDEQDPLMKSFIDLRNIINQIEDLRLVDPNVFLDPFLEVIRSEETTGPVTSLALSAINKFLSYGLIDPTYSSLSAIVENIADAVTHARFVGTDQASDGVVLMKIIQVLRTLLMNPEGSVLSNESVCEIMLSCFRLCFEPRLNDLIRRTAEHALRDMVLLLFMRLPQFADDRHSFHIKKLKMRAGVGLDPARKSRKTKATTEPSRKTSIPKLNVIKTDENEIADPDIASPNPNVLKLPPLATTPATPAGNIVDMQGSIAQTPTTSTVMEEHSSEAKASGEEIKEDENDAEKPLIREESVENDADAEDDGVEENASAKSEEYINSMGVRFTQQNNATAAPLLPYGLPCIRELFRFLISLCNPLDKQNTDAMMHMGLSLLTVALEIGADSIGKYDTLLGLVKDELCRNLFSLLNTERLTIFASDLQVCFLLFESLRSHLKFQLEYYLGLLSDIIGSENLKMAYEVRELALENILQLWRIPGFAAELFVNYDCDLYCTNLFENLTKLLSKTTLWSYNTQMIYGTQVIAMDAVLSVIESVEKNCKNVKSGSVSGSYMRHSRNNSTTDNISFDNDNTTSGGESTTVENISNFIGVSRRDGRSPPYDNHVSKEQLLELKNKKQIVTQGTELFNTRADKGIQFLMENGILKTPLDAAEVALFLRENPGLDKNMIGEYISKKKNVEIKILEAFVKSFDFSNMTLDKAMRIYLETFRLPGEAPLIFLVVEHFADHWHKCNNEPFANTDAAFKVAYSVIMLNMDQHNHNAKRLNIPMTADDYLKNLRGLNGNKGDFSSDVLKNIFHAIKNEEIIMPAEQTGIVRENYLWKVLLRRGFTKDGQFCNVYDGTYDKELYQIIWSSAHAALSYMFDKSFETSLIEKSKAGFVKCALISSHYNLNEDFDAVVLTLCTFSTLLYYTGDVNEITTAVAFGQNPKAQEALKCVFSLVHDNGDCMREGWKNILDVVITLFRIKLLPKTLMEVEDFCDPSGKIVLIHEKPPLPKTESGILSSLYSYLSNDSQRVPTYEEQEIIKKAKKIIKDCQIDQMIVESKFLQFESLQELIKSFIAALRPPDGHKSIVPTPYFEDQIVFLLEVMVKILIQNRDRLLHLWNDSRDTIYLLLMGGATCGYEYLLVRTTIAVLKLAIYLMRNEELCPTVLQSLNMLLMLKPSTLYRVSKHISIGMYELLKTSAQNIHTEADWAIVFTILECVGAGATPPECFSDEGAAAQQGVTSSAKSDGAVSSEDDSGLPDRGYISDSEVTKATATTISSSSSTPILSPSGENWILVNNDNDKISTRSISPINTLAYPCKLINHSPFALVKCWDCLAFIVRNVAHITPYNFESCVKCIRTFVEASFNGGKRSKSANSLGKINAGRKKKKEQGYQSQRSENSSDSESDDIPERYPTIAIQLLDLMHTLHTRTAQIFRWWAEEGGAVPQCSALWEQGWRPILQGISRLATDQRRQVRTSAITCLQRALLVHDLQTLSGPEWSSCFKQVLFPLLNELLAEKPTSADPSLVEESRMRAATIMSKVFLHHLTPLIVLPNFNELWLEILEYLEKFMNIGSDMLYEAVLESLKNMLLVMYSVRVFHSEDGMSYSSAWEVTWSRIDSFLPHLKEELFKKDLQATHTLNQPQTPIPNVSVLQTPMAVPHQEYPSSNAQAPLPVTIPQQPQQGSAPPRREILPGPISTITGPQNVYRTAPPSHQLIQDGAASVGMQNSIILLPPGNLLHQAASPLLVPGPHYPSSTADVKTPTTSNTSIPYILPQNILHQTPLNSTSPGPILSAQVSTPSHIPTYAMSPVIPEVEKFAHTNNHDQPSTPKSVSQPDETHQFADVNNPPIPISHLMAGNQYPSLNRVPTNIAQSFSPVFIQPQQQSTEGGDIYSDYVNNPYNLTLTDQVISTADEKNLTPEKLNISNMFQSTNYFGATENGQIPPGSEMLFGRP